MRRFAGPLLASALAACAIVLGAINARAMTQLTASDVDWMTVNGVVRFHMHFSNPDPTPSIPMTGMLTPQPFGAFVPAVQALARSFDIPTIAAKSFFDVFVDIPLTALPQNPPNVVPGGGAAGGPCPPENHWDGNVDIVWGDPATGQQGHVVRHVGRLRVCPGNGCSLIHITTGCAGSATWSLAAPICPGFHVTFFDEDQVTPAPAALPPGWTGWICVTADPGVTVPSTCCFTLLFNCAGSIVPVEICAITCNCNPTGGAPQPGPIDWTTLSGGIVRFQVHWTNPSPNMATAPAQGDLYAQSFGVYLPDAGLIGHMNIPPIPAGSFFDVFIDVPLNSLPANPPKAGGPGPNGPCPPDTHWDGNVDLIWNSAAGGGQIQKHKADIVVCPGDGASLIHTMALGCTVATGIHWTLSGVCPGWSVTLLNEDFTPAPNPLPPGWTGFVAVRAGNIVPVPDTCCFQVTFDCGGVPAVLELCGITCNCQPVGVPPQPGGVGWGMVPGSGMVRFHVRWLNPDPNQPSMGGTGQIMSQMFGAFLPDYGPIGSFDIPPIAPNSFFDVFFDVAMSQLPPQPQKVLTGGGPSPLAGNCPPDSGWSGNVDIVWNTPAGGGIVNKHYGTLLLNSAGGHGMIHVISGCTAATGTVWWLGPLCPGFTATLLNEDMTLAPNPLPAGWTGWFVMGAAGTAPGTSCCVDLFMSCGGQNAVIRICAVTCDWGAAAGVGPDIRTGEFGIRNVTPNPTTRVAAVSFVLPKAGRAALEIFDAAGHRVKRVAEGPYGAGPHTVIWDGRDARGNPAMPGAYFVRLTTLDASSTHKLVLRP